MLGLDEAEACFGGSMTVEDCRSMVPAKCYAVHSGEFADSPRQGRPSMRRARIRVCCRGRLEVTGS